METLTRITPNNILELKDNEIFVFGSNMKGLHGAGAAKDAHEKFGAKWGVGVGKTGQSYAIPTVITIGSRAGLGIIQRYINDFIIFVVKHPKLTFFVTEIGCGLAGYKPHQIAPMFKDAVQMSNVHLPQRFWDIILEKQLN